MLSFKFVFYQFYESTKIFFSFSGKYCSLNSSSTVHIFLRVSININLRKNIRYEVLITIIKYL